MGVDAFRVDTVKHISRLTFNSVFVPAFKKAGDATFTGIPSGKYVDAVTGDIQNVTNGTLKAGVSGKGNMKVYVLDTAKTPAPGRVIYNGTYLTDGGTE